MSKITLKNLYFLLFYNCRPILNVLPKLIPAPQHIRQMQACTILSLPPPSYEEHVQSVKREEVFDPSNAAFLFNLCSTQQPQQMPYEDLASEGK